MSRTGESCTQLCNTPLPAAAPRLGKNPWGPGCSGRLRGAVRSRGCRRPRWREWAAAAPHPREPAAQGQGVRGFKPGVRPEWGPPRCSGSAHRCQDWQARRRCSWLLAVSPRSPRPLFFSHPLFRRHQLQLLQSVKNVKEIFQFQEG